MIKYWGVAKLVKAPDFDSGMRRFESFLPSHLSGVRDQARFRPGSIMQQVVRRSAEGLSPEGLMIFTGNANPKLASDVAAHLHLSLGKATVGKKRYHHPRFKAADFFLRKE